MSMQIPKPIYDTWKAVADKFKVLHQGTDDQRREATKRGVQTIRARFAGKPGELNGERWAAKTQHSNGWAAQSKDTIAYVPSGPVTTGRLATMDMFDMINGGTRETNPYPLSSGNHEETPPNDAAYILVPEPYDWLADEQPGNGDGGGDTPTDSDLQEMQRQIAAMQAEIRDMRRRLDAKVGYDERIALQMDKGKFVCAEGGGPDEPYQDIHFRSRDAVGGWEQYTVRKP